MDEESEYLISQLVDEWRNISLCTGFRNQIVDVLSSPSFPIDQLRILAESDISFFASGPNILGQVLEWNRAIGRIVYFSPTLLLLPLDIKGVIAHELARVFLGTERNRLQLWRVSAAARHDEEEADELAASWGFPVPEAYREQSLIS